MSQLVLALCLWRRDAPRTARRLRAPCDAGRPIRKRGGRARAHREAPVFHWYMYMSYTRGAGKRGAEITHRETRQLACRACSVPLKPPVGRAVLAPCGDRRVLRAASVLSLSHARGCISTTTFLPRQDDCGLRRPQDLGERPIQQRLNAAACPDLRHADRAGVLAATFPPRSRHTPWQSNAARVSPLRHVLNSLSLPTSRRRLLPPLPNRTLARTLPHLNAGAARQLPARDVAANASGRPPLQPATSARTREHASGG